MAGRFTSGVSWARAAGSTRAEATNSAVRREWRCNLMLGFSVNLYQKAGSLAALTFLSGGGFVNRNLGAVLGEVPEGKRESRRRHHVDRMGKVAAVEDLGAALGGIGYERQEMNEKDTLRYINGLDPNPRLEFRVSEDRCDFWGDVRFGI